MGMIKITLAALQTDLKWWGDTSHTVKSTHENANYNMNPNGEQGVGQPSLVSAGSRACLPGHHARWKPNTLTFAVRQLL